MGQTATHKQVDIAIIGGGMVGASLAALLPEHLNVMVLESFPMPPANAEAPSYQPSYDARSTALSKSSEQILQRAGVWEALQAHAEPILDVHVSDKGHWGSALLKGQEEAMNALGYVVENAWLGRSLLYRLQQKPNIQFCCPATVANVKPLADAALLDVTQGDETFTVKATLAVIADGANSKICQSLGIHTHVSDYGHMGIVCNVTTSQAHQGIAYERFTDSGPMALLPLPQIENGEYRSALVWTLPTEQGEALMDSDDKAFLQQLQERFGLRQGYFTHVGSRHAYPLRLTTAEEQARQHIVVLGNAAHSLHPVAGQGFNLALRDVDALCKKLQDAEAQGKTIGDLSILKTYVDEQLKDQHLTTLFSDVLPGLFSRQEGWLKAGRGLGLLGLELLPSLKTSFVRFATGLRDK